ncbi:MAG: DUF4124 domain-containing protein [Granulosicoccus sp.]
MLGQLVGKLLIKAFVMVLIMAGIMTYGIYLRGGDAGGVWKKLASGAIDNIGNSLSRTKNDAVGLAGNLTGGADASDGLLTGAQKTEVYTWKDAEGVTHFGTAAPLDVTARSLTVDPNVNILAPVAARELNDVRDESRNTRNAGPTGMPQPALANDSGKSRSRDSRSSQIDQSVKNLEEEMGGPLPGFAGQILSSGAANGNGTDPAQLIRLLQSASE